MEEFPGRTSLGGRSPWTSSRGEAPMEEIPGKSSRVGAPGEEPPWSSRGGVPVEELPGRIPWRSFLVPVEATARAELARRPRARRSKKKSSKNRSPDLFSRGKK